MTPTLYFDLGSPYAYLAAERATAVLGAEPKFEPILLGAIFKLRGSGSWSQTPERERNIAEIERRAREYGLPPLKWPPGWPPNGLHAMRAAVWAKRRGAAKQFALAAYRRTFVDGADIGDIDVLAAAAESIGLSGDELRAAIDDPEIKAALRAATDEAWSAGVIGVPSVRVGGEIFYGDDQLERAAQALR